MEDTYNQYNDQPYIEFGMLLDISSQECRVLSAKEKSEKNKLEAIQNYLNSSVPIWKRFELSGYEEDIAKEGQHVLRATRNYAPWIIEDMKRKEYSDNQERELKKLYDNLIAVAKFGITAGTSSEATIISEGIGALARRGLIAPKNEMMLLKGAWDRTSKKLMIGLTTMESVNFGLTYPGSNLDKAWAAIQHGAISTAVIMTNQILTRSGIALIIDGGAMCIFGNPWGGVPLMIIGAGIVYFAYDNDPQEIAGTLLDPFQVIRTKGHTIDSLFHGGNGRDVSAFIHSQLSLTPRSLEELARGDPLRIARSSLWMDAVSPGPLLGQLLASQRVWSLIPSLPLYVL